jgi:hypothetical protein
MRGSTRRDSQPGASSRPADGSDVVEVEHVDFGVFERMVEPEIIRENEIAASRE